MGREGIQWQLDNLIDPEIKKLEVKLRADSENTNLQKALEVQQDKRQRMITKRDKAGSYYEHPNSDYLPDRIETCNYATTAASIGSQMNGSGTACANGSSADTWVDIQLMRNGAAEYNHQDGTGWVSFGVTRAKIPSQYGCSVDSESHAFWGPFWWDAQDSRQNATDSDCQ